MPLNNAYKMYKALVKQHTPERRFLNMGNAMRELTHDLCQRGPAMRKRRAEHRSWTRDMSKLFGWITSRKICLDAKGVMTVQSVMPREETPTDNYALLKNQQQQSPLARSPEQGGEKIWKVLLGRLPREKVEHSKTPAQQRHAYVLRGMQCISRKGCIPLQRVCQGCTGELPPALPPVPS
jgi:hypothetical protein